MKHRGRKLSDGGVTARFYHAVKDAHLAAIIRVDLASELFTYNVNEQALRRAKRLDGKLLLVTNVADLPAEEVVTRYKSLADIERGFRILKSEIGIAPRLPPPAAAHSCARHDLLHGVDSLPCDAPPAAGCEQWPLARADTRTVAAHLPAAGYRQRPPISGVTTLTKEQTGVLRALNVKRPDAQQLSLL